MDITKNYQKDAVLVRVVKKELTVKNIDQYYYEVKQKNKEEVLSRLLDMYNPKLSLVFCNTKKRVDELTEALKGRGYFAEGLHGDMKQSQRDRVMKGFRSGKTEILIATDVAARGIDVDDVEAVFNYDVPQDDEFYVHRIGRTGRAGRSGIAFSFCDVEEVPYLKDIQKLIGKEVPVAGGHMFETVEVKEAVAEKKKAIKEESKRRNMFGSKRDGSFWRNKKRTAAK